MERMQAMFKAYVAYFCGSLIAIFALENAYRQMFPVATEPVHTLQLSCVNFVHQQLIASSIAAPDEKRINGYLAGELGIADLDEAPLDLWDNAYRCVLLRSNDSLLDIGLYSCGPDGVSETGGNDVDDINTWRGFDEDYWRAIHRDLWRSYVSKRCAIALGIAIVVGMWRRSLSPAPEQT